MRRQPVQRRSRETVEKILEAAEQLVVDVGYETFISSPDLLLQATGVSRGSLYAYFNSPQAVLDEIALRALRTSLEQISAIADSPPATWEIAVDLVFESVDADYRRPVIREIWLNRALARPILREDMLTNSSIAAQFHALLTQFPPRFARFESSQSAVAIEIVDHLLRYAYRDTPEGDPALRAEARTALMSYLAVHA